MLKTKKKKLSRSAFKIAFTHKVFKVRKYVILMICAALLVTSASGYAAYSAFSPAPKPVVKTPPAKSPLVKPAQPSTATTTPGSAPAKEAETTSQTSPIQTPAAKPKSKSSTQSEFQRCLPIQNQLYIENNQRVAQTYAVHQDVLAGLQEAYNEGQYTDPDTGETIVMTDHALQEYIDAENDRFQQEGMDNYNTYTAALAAAHCS